MSFLRHLVFGCLVAALLTGADSTNAQTHSLPSWNDSAVKSAIVDFVAGVTREGGVDFVPVRERITAGGVR